MGLREIVLGLWLAGAGAVGAERFDYDVTYGPLRVGRLTLQAVRGGDGYEAHVTIRSAGLAGMVRAVRFDAVAVGVAGKSLRPESYVEQADTGRRVSQMRLDWQGGLAVVTAYHADPAEVVPPATAPDGALDPASALLVVLSGGTVCGQAFVVFDGQRLSGVALQPGREDGTGLICAGRFTRLAGYRPEDMAERRQFALRLTYAPEGAGMALVGAEVQTLYGKVRLKRR